MKQGRSSPVQDLLSKPIDPRDKSFWKELKQTMLITKKISYLDRRSVLNLKLIFTELSNDLQHLSTISRLIKLLQPILKSDIGGEIGNIVNAAVFSKSSNNSLSITDADVSEYLNSVNFVCMNNIALKRVVFDEIVEAYTDGLISGVLSLKSPLVLSALFELLINLISQCAENRTLLSQYLKEEHLAKCLNLIMESNNSLSQMLIAELLWRSINGISDRPNMSRIFGKYYSKFNEINLANFRGSLHSFIKEVNNNSKSPVVHIEYDSIHYNQCLVDVSGWIDINTDTIAIWIFQKGNCPLPDVIVLRSSMLYDRKANRKKLEFSTKEKMVAFEQISQEKPCRFEFFCHKSITKAQIDSFMASMKKSNQITIVRKKKENMSKLTLTNQNETTSTNSVKKRVYANAPKKKSVLISEPDDKQMKNTFDIDDFNFGKTTQEKEINLNNIEKMLTDFQRKSEDSINATEALATSEISEIVAKLVDNMRVLNQMAVQHKELTETTTDENKGIAESVLKLGKEFQERHNETTMKKELITIKAKNDIEMEKKKFLNETNAAFESNAIVGLSSNLTNLRELMCEIPI